MGNKFWFSMGILVLTQYTLVVFVIVISVISITSDEIELASKSCKDHGGVSEIYHEKIVCNGGIKFEY